MEFTPGQVVYSKCGRDCGRAFLIIMVEGEYLYLADGTLRTLEKPKKKKRKHVQYTSYVILDLKEKLENKSYILNSDIAKVLKQYSVR